jgi:hypothetical protein
MTQTIAPPAPDPAAIPPSKLKKVNIGVYMLVEDHDQIKAWKTPTFRTAGDIVSEMIRVLKKVPGWKPGQDLHEYYAPTFHTITLSPKPAKKRK